jgi:hypothetical protein
VFPVASPMWMKVSSIWWGIRMGLLAPISNSLGAGQQESRTAGQDSRNRGEGRQGGGVLLVRKREGEVVWVCL